MNEPRYETIRPRTKRLGHWIVHIEEARSTMDEARRLAEADAPEGTVVVADRQTAGRGRDGRVWTQLGTSLYATLILRPPPLPDAIAPLSLATGLALARSIARLLRLEAQLKWPNDVWLSGRKVAGILIEGVYDEAGPRFLLVGIGVNGDVRPEEIPLSLRAASTSLSIEAGRHVCLPALLKIFCEEYERLTDALWRGDAGLVLDEVLRRSLVVGRRVRAETRNGKIVGIARGLGPRGELLVETAKGTERIEVGDCELLREEPATSPST